MSFVMSFVVSFFTAKNTKGSGRAVQGVRICHLAPSWIGRPMAGIDPIADMAGVAKFKNYDEALVA
jgi:hypothetical protein